MEKTTVVAFYGGKPEPLESVIGNVQEQAVALLPGFVPRPMHEIHATMIGLESPARHITADEFTRFLRQVAESLDEAGVLLQFGGFPEIDLALTSRGQRLYERSFLVNGGSVVLIGWPVDADGQPVPVLDRLRRSYHDLGFRHRYHATPSDTDPDSYMVVGNVPAHPGPSTTAGVAEIRRLLASAPGARVPLRSTDISVVRYESTTLTAKTSQAYPIVAVDADQARRLLAPPAPSGHTADQSS